ncbi:MAG: hypothetical protein ABII71_06265 [Candidatus Micrarchaeota archaeon]
MRWALALLLLLSVAHADFLLERVDVRVSDIQDDGSAKVHESIRFIMIGDYAQALYDSGFSNNDLAFWSTATDLKDVKKHVNPEKGEVKEFRLRPQPRTSCNPIQGTCHGELILDYWVYPSYNISEDGRTRTPLSDSGLFDVERYKPRTARLTINPEALAFTKTEQGNIIIDDNVYLIVELPQESLTLDVNPLPIGMEVDLPARVDEFEWSDMILVRFTLEFEVENSLDKEVGEFFSDLLWWVVSSINSPHGYALVLMLAILVGAYIYINISKRKMED